MTRLFGSPTDLASRTNTALLFMARELHPQVFGAMTGRTHVDRVTIRHCDRVHARPSAEAQTRRNRPTGAIVIPFATVAEPLLVTMHSIRASAIELDKWKRWDIPFLSLTSRNESSFNYLLPLGLDTAGTPCSSSMRP